MKYLVIIILINHRECIINGDGDINKISINMISFLPLIILILISENNGILLPVMAALIHEAGHLLCAAIMKTDISSMSFSLGGATIKTDGEEFDGIKKAVVLLGGSGANLLMMCIALVFKLGEGFAMSNAIIGAFNLLPVKGLDGGSALELVLDMLLLPEATYRITRAISLVFLFIIWATAIFLMIFSGGNITMYCVFWALFFANYKAFS